MEDDKVHWLNIRKRVVFKIRLLSYKAVNGLALAYLNDMINYAHHDTMVILSDSWSPTVHQKVMVIAAFDVTRSLCLRETRRASS